jgi:MATE family multidrug resistance protein
VVVLLRYVAAYCLLDAINVVFVSAIKGAGDTRFVMIATVLTSGGSAAIIWAGHKVWDFGLHWAWSGLTAWICLLGVIYMARFLQGKWKSMRVIEPELALDADERLESEALAASDVV